METCKLCQKECKDLRALQIHVTMAHVKKGHIKDLESYYTRYISKEQGKCFICGKPTPFVNLLAKYKKTCSKECTNISIGPKNYKCEICGEGINNLNNLKSHIENYHNSDSIEYYNKYIGQEVKCKECGKQAKLYSFELGYYQYCEDHLSKQKSICKICNQPCRDMKDLQFHVTRIHIKRKEIESLKEYYNTYIGEQTYCQVCGKETKLASLNDGYLKHCCKRCQFFGTDESRKKKLKEKYGSENYFSSKKWKEKCHEVYKEKLGYDNPSQSPEVKRKCIKKIQEKHGVDYYFQSKEWLDNAETIYQGYIGYDNPSQSPKIKEKKLQKRCPKIYDNLLDHCEFENITPLFDYETFKNSNIKKLSFRCETCNETFEDYRIDLSVVPKCKTCYIKRRSSLERKVYNNLIKIYDETKILSNDRKVLKGKEIDLYFPDIKFGVELNGVYWHSENHIASDYHKLKSELANSEGIDLYHFWETEIVNKFDIVMSMIKSKLNLNQKLNARDCEFKEIENSIANKFLNENHIQGRGSNQSISLGLYHNNDLVSVMTFSNIGNRNIFGNRNQKSNSVEMLRYATKLNHTIVGGFSKLLNHSIDIIKSYKIEKIISYANARFTNKPESNVYTINGFNYDSTSEPGYWYFFNGKLYHRYSFTKHRLIEIANKLDISVDNNDTERSLAAKLGLMRLYDCGHYKFTYSISS